VNSWKIVFGVFLLLVSVYAAAAIGILVPSQTYFDLDANVLYAKPASWNNFTVGFQNGKNEEVAMTATLSGLQASFNGYPQLNLTLPPNTNQHFEQIQFFMPDGASHEFTLTLIEHGSSDSMVTTDSGTSRTIRVQKYCVSNWSCSNFGGCSNNVQLRTCVDANACGKNDGPSLTQSCCTPNWECDSYSGCSGGKRHRVCSDSNSCGVDSGKPVMADEDCGSSGGNSVLTFSNPVVAVVPVVAAEEPTPTVVVAPLNTTPETNESNNSTVEQGESMSAASYVWLGIGAVIVIIILYNLLKKKKKPMFTQEEIDAENLPK